MNADWFQFAVDNARAEFKAPVTSPRRTEAARPCCAEFAHVVESNHQHSIWRCPVCSRLWSVAH